MVFLFKLNKGGQNSNKLENIPNKTCTLIYFNGSLSNEEILFSKQLLFYLEDVPISKFDFYFEYKKIFEKLFKALPEDHKIRIYLRAHSSAFLVYMKYIERNIKACIEETWFKKSMNEMEEHEQDSVLYFIKNLKRFKTSTFKPTEKDYLQLEQVLCRYSSFVFEEEKVELSFLTFIQAQMDLIKFDSNEKYKILVNIIDINCYHEETKFKLSTLLDIPSAKLKTTFITFVLIQPCLINVVQDKHASSEKVGSEIDQDEVINEIKGMFHKQDKRLFNIRFIKYGDKENLIETCEDIKDAIREKL